MSHTIRIYNRWNIQPYHPYKQFCMGNCPLCRNEKDSYRYVRKQAKILLKTLKLDFLGQYIPEPEPLSLEEIMDEIDQNI